MAATSPSSQTLTHDPSYPHHPSPPMSLYQENEVLQQQRDSISPELSNEQSSNRLHSPPLQFELHDAFLQPPRPNHAHSHAPLPASSAYAIQSMPVSMFPLLSPIISEGSPVLTDDRNWTFSPSDSHADLHKVGCQRLEHELSPVGLGVHVSGEDEEEGGAVGRGGEGIMLGTIELDKLPSNGVNSESHQDDRDEKEQQELTLIPETVSMETASVSGETQLVELAQFVAEGTSKVEQFRQTLSEQQSERIRQVDNDQGLPCLDEQHTTLNHFPGELAPPTAVVDYNHSPSNRGGYMKAGLATPHMLRSAWETQDKDAQVIYKTSIQQGSQSPQADTHFLEDFID